MLFITVIRLKLLIELISPFSKTETILDYFSTLGKVQLPNDRLKRILSGADRTDAPSREEGARVYDRSHSILGFYFIQS